MGTYAASAATVTLTGNRFAAFDITDLAKYWKIGFYDDNCGFVLISTTETTGNNALCSSEYTTTDWRPYVVATYQFDSETLSVGEGSTITLTPPDISGTITWASNNTAIATVNSSGVVTGIRAGSADITASVGGAVHKTYRIEVTIPNGIYRIKNAVNGLYMSVKDAGITDGTQLIQQGLYNTDPLQLGQLWRITHLGSGRYTIRPLHMQSMGLTYYLDDLRIEDIGLDNSISGCAGWRIFYESTGYVFRNAESGITILPTENSNAPGTILKLDDYSSTNTYFRWTPTLIGTVNSDLLLYDTATGGLASNAIRYVAPGETLSLSQLQLAISFSSAVTMDQSVTWTTSDSTAVTVHSDTGAVTGLAPGTISTVTATKIVNGITYTESYTLHVTAVPEGEHFIRSKSSGKYVDIQDQVMANGTVIHQWDFHGGDTQRWVFTHLGDGIYTIHSANSTDAHYLGVSEDSTANDQPIVLRTGTLADGMKWKISTTDSGAYKLTPLTGEANDRVLALDVGVLGIATANGDTLQQRDYVNDTNYKDEWEIYPVGSDAFLLGVIDSSPGHDHQSVYGSIMPSLMGLGYENYNVIITDSISTADTQDHMEQCRIFVSRGHGGPYPDGTRILLSENQMIELRSSDIFDYSTSTPVIDLSNCDLMIFVGCETAAVDGRSLPDAAVAAGAAVAIGFTESIGCDAANDWTKSFWGYLLEGYNIEDAADKAAKAILNVGNVDSYRIVIGQVE